MRYEAKPDKEFKYFAEPSTGTPMAGLYQRKGDYMAGYRRHGGIEPTSTRRPFRSGQRRAFDLPAAKDQARRVTRRTVLTAVFDAWTLGAACQRNTHTRHAQYRTILPRLPRFGQSPPKTIAVMPAASAGCPPLRVCKELDGVKWATIPSAPARQDNRGAELL